MYARTYGMAIAGLDGYAVTVEVNITSGLPAFEIVGLPTAAVREARERVRAAITNAGFVFPMRRIVVNLAPADIRKDGAGLDMAIAMGIILASDRKGQTLSAEECRRMSEETLFIGEVSLDGKIKPVEGVLAMAIAAQGKQWRTIVTAEGNGAEAKAGFGNAVIVAATLKEVVAAVEGTAKPRYASTVPDEAELPSGTDFSEVSGQETAKKALEIAAAGGHHVLLDGVPGAGKTMLARCLPSILPPLNEEEQLTISRIYSVAGLLPSQSLMRIRPFRHPHHTITVAGMAGGGTVPRPGELTLSHGGVLFLDEVAEFKRPVLEVLRQPLEEGYVTISRANGTYRYMCRFILVMAMNPCPCGWYGHEDEVHQCVCTPHQVERYRHMISGPLRDRLDMIIPVDRPKLSELHHGGEESSESIRRRVVEARCRQQRRAQAAGLDISTTNGMLSHRDIRQCIVLSTAAQEMLDTAFTRLHISLRSYDKLIRVAQTVADLEGKDTIEVDHIAMALAYRGK